MMKRRNFIGSMGIGAVGLTLSPGQVVSQDKKDLKVIDIQNYLRSLYKIDRVSVDQIIIGDPQARVTKLGTCWMPYWDTLKKAVKAGVNTLIVHEPTFYTHRDLQYLEEDFGKYPEAAKKSYLNLIAEKKKWIEENRISIIRCHDVLDIIPGFGIPFAFGEALGFPNEEIIHSEHYYNVYRIKEARAKDVARMIASKLSVFGQPGVAFYGDENRLVKTVGLGTGVICDPVRFMGLGADLRIAIDDTVKTWTQTYFSSDSGHPLIILNHGTSEENGMRTLNARLKQVFKNYDIIHFSQGCSYKWIS